MAGLDVDDGLDRKACRDLLVGLASAPQQSLSNFSKLKLLDPNYFFF